MTLIFEDEKLERMNLSYRAEVHDVDYGLDVIRGFQKTIDILTCIENIDDLAKIPSLEYQQCGRRYSIKVSAGYRIYFISFSGRQSGHHAQQTRPPAHPGMVVYDELEHLHIPQTTFAEQTGISRSLVNQVLKCRRGMTTEFALLTEAFTGIPAQILLKMQMRLGLWQTGCLLKIKKRIERISDRQCLFPQTSSEDVHAEGTGLIIISIQRLA